VFASWRAIYQSELQSFWALIVVPALFLGWVLWTSIPSGGVEPRAAGFVHRWAIVFAIETILDPIVTGPLLRLVGATRGVLADWAMLPFVLLGDFRVLLLVFFVLRPEGGLRPAMARAGAWTIIVPLVAGADVAVMRAVLGRLPGTAVWLIYELLFLVVVIALRGRAVLPETEGRPALRRYLGAVLAYVGVYYALWALADVLILLRSDVGWAFRIVANQLYYAFWVPFAYLAFFSLRYASSSSATHAST